MMQSRITGGETSFLYKARILSKYDISYFRCNETGFIQTEEPFWLEEAYSSAITKLDLGLVQRNIEFAAIIPEILLRYFDHNASFLDYAGGYGLFTRLMRNKGFDFYNTDKYCENIFSEFSDLKYAAKAHFELTTAFEVFEHLPDPLGGIKEMLEYSDNLLFSTVLVPEKLPTPEDWWYFSLETGQHVSFYTPAALTFLAGKINKHFYTNGKTMHLFTKNPLASNPFAGSPGMLIKKPFIKLGRSLEKNAGGRKKSLLDKDIADAKKRIS